MKGDRGDSVHATPFAIPYGSPLQLSAGTVREHCAVLIELSDGGVRGFGEVAPGPGAGRAEVAKLANRAVALARQIGEAARSFERGDSGPLDEAVPPELRAGVEAAALDWLARKRGVTVADTVAGRPIGAGSIAVNAMVDRRSPEAARAAIEGTIANGYRCLKIKAAPDNVEDVEVLLRYVRSRHGDDIALRVDCNGGWSVDEARAAMRRLRSLDIEYIEQPVRTLAELRALRDDAPVPIAADEALSDLAQVEQAIEQRAVDVLVLKPARLGLRDSIRAAAAARQAGIDCVVTSTLESSLGVAGALHVAAIVDRGNARPRAHGLGTVPLLAGDIAEPRLIPVDGRLCLPEQAGCGVRPATAAVERWRLR